MQGGISPGGRSETAPVLTGVNCVSNIRPRMADPRRDLMADDETPDEDFEEETLEEDLTEPEELADDPEDITDDLEGDTDDFVADPAVEDEEEEDEPSADVETAPVRKGKTVR